MRRIISLVSMRHTVLLLAAMIALVLVSGVAPKPADASTRIATKTFSNTAQINFAYGIPGWVEDGATAAWGWPKFVKSVAKAVVKTATEVVETVAETATEAVETVVDTATEVVETVAETAEAVGEGITDGATAAWEGITDGATAAWEGYEEFWNIVAPFMQVVWEKVEPKLWKVISDAYMGKSVTFGDFFAAAIDDCIRICPPTSWATVANSVAQGVFMEAVYQSGFIPRPEDIGTGKPHMSCSQTRSCTNYESPSDGAAEDSGGAEEQPSADSAAQQLSSDDESEQPSSDDTVEQPSAAEEQPSSDDTVEQPSAAEEQTTSGGAAEQPSAAEEQYQSQ